jgi:glutaryl-CoA dehydrogenase
MSYAGFDFYKLDALLTPHQRAVRDQVREYVENVVLPHINPYWERGEFAYEIAMRLKELPISIMGGVLRGYGCAGLDPLEVGLVVAR